MEKTIKLTRKQNLRFQIIRNRLWEISSERNKLNEELKAMGLEFDLCGRLKVKVEVQE